MCKIILEDIKLENINEDYFSFHLSSNSYVFVLSEGIYKVFYKGFVGINEIRCFFTFCICFIIADLSNDSFVIYKTYSYLCDLLLSIAFIILENKILSYCDRLLESSYII